MDPRHFIDDPGLEQLGRYFLAWGQPKCASVLNKSTNIFSLFLKRVDVFLLNPGGALSSKELSLRPKDKALGSP